MGTKKASGLYYILAPDHHGAAQISLILNNHPDILSLADGNPPRSDDAVCACGEKVIECPFWTQVTDDVMVQDDDPIPNLLPQAPFITGNTSLNNALNGLLAILANEVTPKFWRAVYESAERFLGIQERFLSSCYDWFAHKVYVDGERSPLKLMVIASMGLPVKGIIHVVRDPRGYAAAVKRDQPSMMAEQIGLEWMAEQGKIRKVKRLFSRIPSLTIRYEDLVEAPEETAKNMLEFMGLREESLLHAPSDSRKNHLIGAGDYLGYTGAIIEREKWQNSLHPEDQARIIKVCEPLFSEFGYKS